MLGCRGRKGRCGKKYERCRKVCWGVGEVKEDVGKDERSEVRDKMWGSVLGPHTLTHLLHSSPHIPPPHTNALPTHPIHSPHTSLPPPTPQQTPYTSPHTQYTSSHSSPNLPLHPNTLPHSPHALSPHLTPQFRICGEVTK